MSEWVTTKKKKSPNLLNNVQKILNNGERKIKWFGSQVFLRYFIQLRRKEK